MNKNTSRRGSLFLLELIVAIFFFCLAGAVCTRFFVKSHTLSADTRNLDMAVNQTTVYAELFQHEADLFAILKEQCPDGTLSEEGTAYTVYYGKDWALCKQSEAVFCLTVNQETADGFSTASMRVTRAGQKQEIYALAATKYIAGEEDLS